MRNQSGHNTPPQDAPVETIEPACRCSDCGWAGPQHALAQPFAWVEALEQRVGPNEIVPAGACPECGALARMDMSAEDRRRLLEELVAGGLTFDEVVECMGVLRTGHAAAVVATQQYASEDLEFDDRVLVSEADGGCWISAWVWVEVRHAGVPS